MHSASAQTGKASEIVSVYILTKCLQTTTAGMDTHKPRRRKTIRSRVVRARTMAVQAMNEDSLNTIEGSVSTSERGCGQARMNDSMCMQARMNGCRQ